MKTINPHNFKLSNHKMKEVTLEGRNYNYLRENIPRKTMNFARKT